MIVDDYDTLGGLLLLYFGFSGFLFDFDCGRGGVVAEDVIVLALAGT